MKHLYQPKSIFLIVALAILSAFNVFLSQNYFLPVSPEQLPASKSVLALANAAIMLILYGGLGFLGMKLSRKLGFADICDPKVSNKQRFLIPALVGVLIGIFFIIADTIFSLFHNMALPHPPFPTSLIASAIAGIGEEAIFRLFFHLFLGLAYFPCYSKKEVAESDFLDCSNFISYRICFQAYSTSNDSFGFE